MFRFKLAAFAFTAAMLVASTGLTSAQTGGDLGSLINAYRQSRGLAPMAITASVTCVASQVAADRAAAAQPGTHNASLTFSLFSSCGAGNFVGEIAAGNGAGTSAAATLAQFVASPEHNAIILDGGNALGCGYATGTYLGFAGFQSWTCDFATVTGPQPQPSPSPQPGPNPQPTPNPQPGPCLPPLCGSTGGAGTPSPAPQPACLPPLCGSTGFTPPSGGSGTGGVTQCLPPLCGSTLPVVPSSGSPASTGGNSSSGGAPASTSPGGTSTSGGAVAGTGGTICLPPTCASTGR